MDDIYLFGVVALPGICSSSWFPLMSWFSLPLLYWMIIKNTRRCLHSDHDGSSPVNIFCLQTFAAAAWMGQKSDSWQSKWFCWWIHSFVSCARSSMMLLVGRQACSSHCNLDLWDERRNPLRAGAENVQAAKSMIQITDHPENNHKPSCIHHFCSDVFIFTLCLLLLLLE